jgi:hypothetical protein
MVEFLSTPREAGQQVSRRADRNYTALKIQNKLLPKSYQAVNFEDIGLHKLKDGKELIKKCRTRLKEVENEFIKIKKKFVEEAQEQEVEAVEDLHNRQRPKRQLPDDDGQDPDDTPF